VYRRRGDQGNSSLTTYYDVATRGNNFIGQSESQCALLIERVDYFDRKTIYSYRLGTRIEQFNIISQRQATGGDIDLVQNQCRFVLLTYT
jgi:hypothetical protein